MVHPLDGNGLRHRHFKVETVLLVPSMGLYRTFLSYRMPRWRSVKVASPGFFESCVHPFRRLRRFVMTQDQRRVHQEPLQHLCRNQPTTGIIPRSRGRMGRSADVPRSYAPNRLRRVDWQDERQIAPRDWGRRTLCLHRRNRCFCNLVAPRRSPPQCPEIRLLSCPTPSWAASVER